MTDSKFIILRVDYTYSEKADDKPIPVTVDVSINGEPAISATGADDSLALQNLIEKMRQRGFDEDDIATAKDQWRISLGEPPEPADE